MKFDSFAEALLEKIMLSLGNWHQDNVLKNITNPTPPREKTFREKLSHRIAMRPEEFPRWALQQAVGNYNNLKPYMEGLNTMYRLLEDEQSKSLMVDLVAFKLISFIFVKLPLSNAEYKAKLQAIMQAGDKSAKVTTESSWNLEKFDLTKFGYDVKLFFVPQGIMNTFITEQYKYTAPAITIQVEKGDVVIDAGGCWGDTALYFASKTGNGGKVYSFEFIPGNLELFKKNLSLNPTLEPIIEVVQNPLWDKAKTDTYFIDKGPASQVSFDKIPGYTGATTTETIDHLVESKGLQQLNFIKMDIEGAEPYALAGAEQSIRKFKPKLAISIYHSMDDFQGIIQYLHNLNVGYKFYLGHAMWNADETVLFAV